MKNNKSFKFKILLNLILLVILSAITYISLPYISYALEMAANEFTETVGAINTPPNGAETKKQIYEHRGYKIKRSGAGTSWAAAEGNTGIQNITSYLNEHMNDAYDSGYGWYYSLSENSSIFCQQHGKPLPDIWDKFLQMFHAHDNDTNNITTVGVTRVDKINYFKNLSDCPKVLEILWKHIEQNQIETIGDSVQEKDLNFLSDNMYQYTNVRLKYTANARKFNTIESYIFTYSNRARYNNDPAQKATWAYKNGSASNNLHKAALAVNESLQGAAKPITPQMTRTSDGTVINKTGTVLDGNNYKVGPIAMNGYTYRWSTYAKDYSGELICGIVEMKVELDNGTVIVLDSASDFTYSYEDNHQKTFSLGYSDSPSLHGYIYPTPNSKFYIKLPIASCTGATSVKRITAKYKWTTADGEGGDLYGKYDKLLWESQGITIGNENDCYYTCGKCSHTGLQVYGGGDYNQTSHWYSGDITYGYPNYREHAYWCSDSLSYCKYGSKAGTIYSWSTSRPNGITDSCSWSWACGKYEHYHGDGSCNSNDCWHTHTSACCSKSTHTHGPSCKDEEGNRVCGKTAHTHGSGCNRLDCSHSHNYNCCSKYEHEHYASSCGRRHTCTKNHCQHGHQNGHHETGNDRGWSYESHDHWCTGPEGVGVRCEHNHGLCIDLTWKVIEVIKDVQSQTLMYVKDAQTYEHTEECYIDNIPLVAKVEIDKYIYDVEHVKTGGSLDNAFAASDVRRGLDEATKENNPVYVETNDLVTYKIMVKNSSAFGVKVRIDDVLPVSSAYKFVSAYLGGEKITDLSVLRSKIISINGNKEASLTVTLQVITLEGKYENLSKIITRNGHTKAENSDDVDYIRTVDDDGPVVNHVSVTCNGTTNTPEWESSDWFILNNYNTFIDKYVYKYDEAKQRENNGTLFITNETSIVGSGNKLKESRLNTNKVTTTVSDGNVLDTIRIDDGAHEKYKEAHPVNVEKYEKVTYAIRVSNEATAVTKNHVTGVKPATQFKPTLIVDKLHNGLKYNSISAVIYYADGTKKNDVLGVSCTGAGSQGEYNIYNITTSNSTIINPGEYIEFYMEVSVVQSNMYLHAMNNSAKIEKISNINDVDVTTRNISTQKETTEYIRLKDLVISGYVWLDIDKDGYMNDTARNELEKINNNINNDAMKKDVEVRLYRVDSDDKATRIRTTKTDANGLYTFARNENLNWYTTYNNTKDYSATTNYQRIDKASNKDANGNYTADSEYYRYYIEFAYDGVVYKSTEVYSGVSNLTQNDGRYNNKYPIDSNAAELEKDREQFNVEHEYISYDVAYDLNMNKSADLDFQKADHASYLMEDPEREVTAKSFILKYNTEEVLKACKTAKDSCGSYYWKQCSNHWDEWQVVIAMGLIDEAQYPNTTDGRKDAQEYLDGVYETLKSNASSSGNTQIIKYLWLYSFHSDVDRTTPETEYLKYINLGLELREDVDLALSKDVYNVKTTINGEEMEYDYNLGDTPGYLKDYIVKKPYGFEIYESDYKYRVQQYIAHEVEKYKGMHGEDELNVEVTFRINLQNVATTDDDSIAKKGDKKLNVRVNEVLDLYDENFMKYANNTITVKTKNASGLLENKTLNVVEAWMFMTRAQAGSRELLEGGQRYSTRPSNGGSKLIYIPDDSGNYVKVKLEVSNNSLYSAKNNDFTADGYNTLYIRGMENQVIPEGGNLDIYVKYVVDKAKLEVEIDKKTYEETSSIKTSTNKVNDNITEVITVIEGTTKAAIERSLKIAEKITTAFKKANGRGTENIAQINAYSVWYTDGRPASLVDKDSNAGNIGIKNTSKDKSPHGTGYSETRTSADDIAFFEDMTYKTGIELVAKSTENTREKVKDKYGEIIITQTSEPLRKISGTVWDDSRTETLGSGNGVQYIADGKYDTTKTKQPNAKYNDNVSINYKDGSLTENKDIKVRNAKAEFIEVIQIDDNHYYEEILTNVTWKQKQNARTNENGDYVLEGFKPGTYIVRFTYGDTVADATAKKDMLIFNGQDYKSTKYTGVPDTLNNVDEVIKSFEKAGVSDARDDEVRRLEVNEYSEVMTNEIAEILKGTANGTSLTPNSTANRPEELKALTDNTYMIADTREFLVKPEKLTSSQTLSYSTSDIYYNALEALMNNHINERTFNITNVDLGIEYRPESEISLMKEINEITLTTEDGQVLVNLHFYTVDKGNDRVHYIDKEKSTGYDLVQFITNNYTTEALLNKIVTEKLQGMVYIQIDEEILQGCTVKITYGFNAQNYSEIDRISSKLNAIRYRDNKATDDIILEYQNKYRNTKPEVLISLDSVMNTKYTASAMSKALVYADTYGIDGQGIVYREIPKTTTSTGNDGYYGRYVGYGYYTGKLSGLDTISSLKFDKILDYIDTNLEYEQKSSYEDTVNKLWGKITSKELVELVYHLRDYRELVNVGAATAETLPKVTNIQGVEYKSMVVSIDDRNVDPNDPNDVDVVRNIDLAKFLEPKTYVVGLKGTDQDTDDAGRKRYTGSITLDVSKVLGAASEADDRTYENMAEIVQFTTLNGRRTNFATTIGNADIHSTKGKLPNANSGSIEFMTASIESDTSATETITLIPPTGLMKSRRPIVNMMETVKVGVEVMSMSGLVVAIVGVIIVIVLFIIRKYKKRRIK